MSPPPHPSSWFTPYPNAIWTQRRVLAGTRVLSDGPLPGAITLGALSVAFASQYFLTRTDIT
jgi:hypothetical protein